MIYQHKHFGVSEYFCKEYGEDFNFPLHLHNSFEFITIFSGEMMVTVDDCTYTLKKGESVLIFPNQMHSLVSRHSKHMLCIFSADLVRAYFSKINEKIPENNMFSLDSSSISSIDNLLPESSVIEKKGLLYTLCSQFDKATTYRKRFNIYDNQLSRIFEFVEENFASNCSLKDLANKTGYSYSYLSRFFKKVTGISFNDYVNQYRLGNACYLLRNTNFSVLQCALDSGFGSLRSFNRNFTSALGVTPSVYRKN